MKRADWLWFFAFMVAGALGMWFGTKRWSAFMSGVLMWEAVSIYIVRTWYVYRWRK